jgi:two-component system response regulator RegA
LRRETGLIVEDDLLYARTLQHSLRRRGFEFQVAASPDEALAAATARRLDLAVIDLCLGSQSGLDLIKPLRKNNSQMRTVLLTGYATFDTAVAAIKRGADDYLLKPVTVGEILRALLTEHDEPIPAPVRMTSVARLEWEHIQRALKASLGNISAAARLLGMHRRSLQRKLARPPATAKDPTQPRE